tara:strand:+ start:1261 stop:1482 length:222 start_codon:yes stop_codon:yes gene_type:complete
VSGDGPETWDEYFELLIKVPGCGKARARAIIDKWKKNMPETFTPKEQEIMRQAAELEEETQGPKGTIWRGPWG